MNLRSIGTQFIGTVILSSVALNVNAQVTSSAQATSASHVAAEMAKGKLNPADSKPGDTVALKLKDDVKSNGQLVLKKGTMITGIVKSVKHADSRASAKGEANSQAQSMMEIEWLAPELPGKSVQILSIALQSVTQTNPIYQHEQSESFLDESVPVVRPVRMSGGAGGNGLLGSVNALAGGVSSSTHPGGQSNAALLNMPSVVAVDHQTSSVIESSLGSSSSGTLFKVGHGELVTAGGSQQSVDIFSHLSNDTVITSPSRNFEISSGAQMQLLVGVRK